MDIIASESVDTFDRNGWSTSIGMGGQDGPEYAHIGQPMGAGVVSYEAADVNTSQWRPGWNRRTGLSQRARLAS